MKAKLMDNIYRKIGRILSILNLEVHYKRPGYTWLMLPLSRDFISTYQKYRIKDTSLVSIGSLHSLFQTLLYAIHLPGDVAQLGVYKGGSVALLNLIVSKHNKTYHAFDTYEGLPKTQTKDNINGYTDSEEPELADTSIEAVRAYLSDYKNIQYHKGYFPDTSNPVKNKKFCFVYLDADLYQSTKDGLNFFFPRLSPGGVIVIDDYGGRRWAGVETAVKEFLEKENSVSLIQIASHQAILIKLR